MAWARENPEATLAYRRGHRGQRLAADMLRIHGITLREIEQMFAEQSGLCEICMCEISLIQDMDNFRNVDHDHSKEYAPGRCRKDAVRGLLCNGCNTTLGKMKDSPAILRAAALYLEAHK
jgi:hypothetical protein